MVSRIVSDICIGSKENIVFWRYIEICANFLSFLLIMWFHQGVISKTILKHRLKGVEKRLGKITLLTNPWSYMILSELMWSMYSVAMLLNCALCCYCCVFHPFEYGIMSLLALHCCKKPPDLISEGGQLHVCSNYDYDSRCDYFIARQRFLAKVLRNSQLRKIDYRDQFRSVHRLLLGVNPGPIMKETPIMEDPELKYTPCTDATNDIPLEDAVQQKKLAQ